MLWECGIISKNGDARLVNLEALARATPPWRNHWAQTDIAGFKCASVPTFYANPTGTRLREPLHDSLIERKLAELWRRLAALICPRAGCSGEGDADHSEPRRARHGLPESRAVHWQGPRGHLAARRWESKRPERNGLG